MECIICGGPLESEVYESINIDRCADCGGVWLDWGELGPIIESRQRTVATKEEQEALTGGEGEKPSGETRQCPKCGAAMDTFNYAVNSGVYLDRCPAKHGIWLDPGELEQVQRVMEELEREYDMSGEAGSERPDKKRCPRCGVGLREDNYEGIELDRCPECGGTWLDGDELARAIEVQERKFSEQDFADIRAEESAATVVAETEVSDKYSCIVCDRVMNRTNYEYTSGIIIDRCPVGHGVWLDKGELGKVQVFSERWEARADDVAYKYKGALEKARAVSNAEVQRDISDLDVSRFGSINRFFRSLARRGLV